MDAAALDEHLKTVRAEYQKNMKSSADIQRKKDAKAALEPIARQAQELHDRLKNLPLPINRNLDYWPVGEDSLLGNLSIELPFLADRATEVMQGWKKKKSRDTATIVAIMHIAQAWRRLTGMRATYKTAPDKGDEINQDAPAPKYYSGKRYGEFLDFLTTACEIVGLQDKGGQPIPADAVVKHFIDLNERNLAQL